MSDSPFRFRGVRVRVDTVETAELDVILYDVPEKVVERIGHSLAGSVQLATDRAVGSFLIREFEGFDIVFIVGREGAEIVVTIGRIRPVDPENPTEVILRNLNLAAIFRVASGL